MSLPFGGAYDPATLQPPPDSLAIFYCSTCGRFGRAAPRPQECSGSERDRHTPMQATVVGEEYESMLAPADDAPIFT
jgi:hypothetical protein